MSKDNYRIDMAELYGFLKLIDLPDLIASCPDDWQNQALCRVNDCLVRLGVLQGEFHWHQHDKEDEFFLVLQGRLLIDLEGETVTLLPHQGFTVPRGVSHRTRAPERTAILMVEGNTVVPTGD